MHDSKLNGFKGRNPDLRDIFVNNLLFRKSSLSLSASLSMNQWFFQKLHKLPQK